MGLPSPVPAVKTHDTAISIAERYKYSISDALILASALETGCNIVYSEDLQDGQVIERSLTIRSPFRS